MNSVEIAHVYKSFENHDALIDVSFTIPECSIFGLLGPNGAGKTTLIRILTQISRADKGSLKIVGQEINSSHSSLFGYLPEERGLFKKMKVGELLEYFALLKGLKPAEAKQNIARYIEKFEIGTWLEKKTEDLSKGMQQKVQFIVAVIHKPSIIILDEPFSGFDPVNAELLANEIKALRDEGKTIILSTHRMEAVEELCENLVLLNKSRVVLHGALTEIKNSYKAGRYRIRGKLKGPEDSDGSWHWADKNRVGEEVRGTIVVNDTFGHHHFLQDLVQRIDLTYLEEEVPSMGEIFKQLTTSKSIA